MGRELMFLEDDAATSRLTAERDAWKALAEARERLITAFYRGADRLDRVPACQGIDAALAELRRLGIEP